MLRYSEEIYTKYKMDDVMKSDDINTSFYCGTALDFVNKRVYFAADGVWDSLDEVTSKKLFEDMKEFRTSLFPAVSSELGIVDLEVNFGQKPFKYPVTDNIFGREVGPVRAVCEASAGISPLMLAVKRKDLECYSALECARRGPMRILIDYSTGKSLLLLLIECYAANRDQLWLYHIERCIRDCPNILQIADYCGQTPLICASTWVGATECVNLLLKNGADVWVQDNLGQTALIHAVRLGHVDSVQLLLGDQVNLVDIFVDGGAYRQAKR